MPLRQLLRRREHALWTCPVCERKFVHRNQMHACGRYTLAEHLAGREPRALALYERFVDLVRACGPVALVPTRSQIGFQVRSLFAAVRLDSGGLQGYLVLERPLEHPLFTRIESVSPRRHLHHFRLPAGEAPGDDLACWLQQAYVAGQQRHLSEESR